MKYMKLGTKPDTFYTKEATRSILTDVPADLIIQINNTMYLLHKFPLLLKCGLLQRLWSEPDDDGLPAPVSLPDIPGGEASFELCAKFCYSITISLSAHNFIQVMAAAVHLRMTESVARGNLIAKLEGFFTSCILQGWKDSIVTLQNASIVGWYDDQRIIQPCLDAIVEKILIPPLQITWSYTYTRPGYSRKHHQSAPKDWWTEDVADLDLDLFRTIIYAVRSTKRLPPALIGEALHVYACKQLPDPDAASLTQSSSTHVDENMTKHKRVLESIVSMIPGEPRSVSGRFLLRLLKVANIVGASPSIKAELVRRSGHQLDEVSSSDLLFPSSTKPQSYDTDIVQGILESFLAQFCRPPPNVVVSEHRLGSMASVALILDCYMELVAHDPDLSVSRFLDLAATFPDIARQQHDGLYHAVDAYLKDHPQISKSERKQLCRLIDCQKLSADARSHAIANDRIPLRTIVQLLFIQQERAVRSQPGPPDRHSVDAYDVHRHERNRRQTQEMQEYQKKDTKEGRRGEKQRAALEPKMEKAGEASSNVVEIRVKGRTKEQKKMM